LSKLPGGVALIQWVRAETGLNAEVRTVMHHRPGRSRTGPVCGLPNSSGQRPPFDPDGELAAEYNWSVACTFMSRDP
jgi:hypothetical protein